MKQKIIFHNPFYGQWFGKNIYNYIARRKSVSKYNYILENIIKSYRSDIYIYLELGQNSFNFSLLKKLKLTKLITHIEFFLWCILNKVNCFKLNILYDLNAVEKEDKFLSFSYGNLDKDDRVHVFEELYCKKIFFLNHFMLDTPIISKNAKKLNIDYFIAENNLTKNSEYFRKYFAWYSQDVYHIPYVFQERFNITDLLKRCSRKEGIDKNKGNFRQFLFCQM